MSETTWLLLFISCIVEDEHYGFFPLSYPNPILSLDDFWPFNISSKILELFSNFARTDSPSRFFLSRIISTSSLLESCILSLSYSYRSSSIFLASWSWFFKSTMICIDSSFLGFCYSSYLDSCVLHCLFFCFLFLNSSREFMTLAFRSTSPSTFD